MQFKGACYYKISFLNSREASMAQLISNIQHQNWICVITVLQEFCFTPAPYLYTDSHFNRFLDQIPSLLLTGCLTLSQLVKSSLAFSFFMCKILLCN
jgi:sensor histidine kinase YesM